MADVAADTVAERLRDRATREATLDKQAAGAEAPVSMVSGRIEVFDILAGEYNRAPLSALSWSETRECKYLRCIVTTAMTLVSTRQMAVVARPLRGPPRL